ncbi:MAG: DUF1553 domain-containing protein [Planctomycetes bacterium]|nr:DUF1553 domain-containing protein [Planctomycetota bacterium]
MVSAGGEAGSDAGTEKLATRIDARLNERIAQAHVKPAPQADDAEFLRRLSLDLTGRIPYVSEVRAFLADTSADKRRVAIERRLASPEYVSNFAHVWRAILLAQATAQDMAFVESQLESWLTQRLRENAPYDQMVREILTVPLGDRIASNSTTQIVATPLAFYQANELKPETLASAVSRVFLGVNLECAQCHNHPFARWKQEQFWEFAGFFAGVQRLRPDNAFAAAPEMMDRRSLMIVGTERTVQARFLDGAEPDWSQRQSPRAALADWITADDNPYFARAAVNRLWAHFFGRGLVNPLDDLGGISAPSHPELLDELAQAFVASGYDLKFLIRAIVSSQAYQRTSRQTDSSQQEPALFARMVLRGLTPEQLFASLAVATGCGEESRGAIKTRFSSLERPNEMETSILQSLAVMNGQLASTVTSPSESKTLAAVIDAPFLDLNAKIETLYLATLSRQPTEAESAQMRTYLSSQLDEREALADVFWALLNSAEFKLNH